MIFKLSRHIRSLGSAVAKRQVTKSQLMARVKTQGYGGTVGSSVLVASVMVTGLLVLVQQMGGLQALELVAFDWMMRAKGDTAPDPRLLVVAITEADIQSQQRWPLSDRVVAKALNELSKLHPAVIGLDLSRDVPQEPGHQELVRALSAPNIIAITKLGDKQTVGVPPPPSLSAESIGLNDLVHDPDDVVRRNLMFASARPGDVFYSFSLRLALRYLEKQGISPRNSSTYPKGIELGKALFIPLEPDSGGYENIDAKGYQILLNYRSGGAIAREVSLTEVLSEKVDPSWVKDKIVLIGTTAPSGKDLFSTPYSSAEEDNFKIPGVHLHGQMVSQLISAALDGQPLFWFWPEWVEVLWMASWALGGGILVWRIQHPLALAFGASAGSIGLFAIGLGVFSHTGWVPVVAPALAFVATGSSVIVSKLLHNAFHDDLTGLPNRAFFINEMGRAKRRSVVRTQESRLAESTRIPLPESEAQRKDSVLGVLFLDLDRFKIVNDGLGHAVGDRLLIAIAHRLQVCLGSTATVARVGGDEFAILVENLAHYTEATTIADQLRRQLALPFNLEGQEVFTTASIGIALGRAGDERDLLRDAHTAVYRAKALGRSKPEVFEIKMQASAIARFQLETDLRRAIGSADLKVFSAERAGEKPPLKTHHRGIKTEFVLHYQPLISLNSGRIAGFEALVRWQHPQRGLVSPGEFIPVAEETGLIIPLGAWVLDEACRQLCRWHEQFPSPLPLMMSVNLSGKQFSQPDLIEQIEKTLQETGADPHSLKLEITESVAMQDVEGAIELLAQMKRLHVKLGLDDFGTGYSSLSHLTRLPTDMLKVDRSFVSHIGDGHENDAIVRIIVTLAHTLSMDVVAEGVETAEQLAALRSLGCEYCQGFFLARPLPVEAAEALLASDPRW